MSIIRESTTILSGTTVKNIITDSIFDYIKVPAKVTVFATQDVVLLSNIEVDFNLGNVLVGGDLSPNIASAAGLGPKQNEDVLAEGFAVGGDRITLRARETSGILNADGVLRVMIVIKDMV